MNADGYLVVVVGAGGELGREVVAALRERAFPVGQWRLYDEPADDEALGEDEGGEDIWPLAESDFDGADVIFLCGAASLAAELLQRAAAAGALVIDLTQTLAESADAVLVVPEVNPELVAEGLERGLIACPIPNAIALAVVLRPLDVAAGLKRVVVTSFEPVSHAGRAGIEELAQQTRDLLSGVSSECGVFPQRIAFNLIPQVGDFLSGGRTRGEWLLESQIRRVLDLPDLPITVTSAYVPVFFGQACSVHVETERPLDAGAARALLRQAPGVLVAEGEDGYPTLAEVIGSDATHVGRVRDDPTVPFGLALWTVVDGLRKGAAVNAVQIAELALRERA